MWLTVTSVLFIVFSYGECFENTKDIETYRCYIKLICELDKIEEFYEVAKTAGHELTMRYISFHKQVLGIEKQEDTLEYFIRFKDMGCEIPDEPRRSKFNEWCSLVGEDILEICIDPTSDLCQKAELGMDHFAAILAKYEALGVCAPPPEGVPEGMMTDDIGKTPTSTFG